MNKGFTLVELLAVIVILGVLSLLVTSAVGTTITGSKENLSRIQIKKIEEATKAYYIKEGLTKYNQVSNACINISELIEKGYMDSETVIDPKKGETILGSVKIINNGNYYTYKYQDNLCTDIDSGKICELVTISEDKYAIGNEYICEVAPKIKRNFYVLSLNMDDTLNLIMNSNICSDGSLATDSNTCLVEWNTELTNINGPITAMQYLAQATSQWEYISNIQINYEDEGNDGQYGYSSITTDNNITKIKSKRGNETVSFKNLRARLPEFIEIEQIGLNSIWLYKNLKFNPETNIDDSEKTIENIYGYWLLSSMDGFNNYAKFASHFYSNIVPDSYELNKKEAIGIRPVINISKENIK